MPDTTVALRDGNNNLITMKARVQTDGSLAFHHVGNPTGQAVVETLVTLTAAHIAGTTPIAAANTTRFSITFAADKDFRISVNSAASYGVKVFATAGDTFEGSQCPTNAIYLSTGSTFVVGDKVLLWEAS